MLVGSGIVRIRHVDVGLPMARCDAFTCVSWKMNNAWLKLYLIKLPNENVIG